MKKTFFTLGLFLGFTMLFVSCGNDEPEDIYGISGKYSGTYRSVSAFANTNDVFMNLYNNPPWKTADAKATIKILPGDSLDIQITSSLYTGRTKNKFTINNGKVTCGNYTIDDGEISYYNFSYHVNSGMNSGGSIYGVNFKAYKE